MQYTYSSYVEGVEEYDPFMVYVPPLRCMTNQATVKLARELLGENAISVISSEPNIFINNRNYVFPANEINGYYYKNIKLTDSICKLEGEFIAFVYGFDVLESYGYPVYNDYLGGISYVVIGCESGPNRRPCNLEWIRSVVRQCKAAGVKCHVKQVPINGKVSHKPEEWPEVLRQRDLI